MGAHKQGFTLIELSIVLVIIGLIVGGVLVGQDLIKAASVRAEVTELEKLETAIYTFRDKYSGLPGDLSNATSFFGTTDSNGYTVANGNGDGTIASTITGGGSDTNCLAGPATQFRYGSVPNEVEEVFHQLNLAGVGNYNIASPAAYTGSGLTNLPDAVLGGPMLVTCLTWPLPNPIASTFQTGTGILFGGVANDPTYNSTEIEFIVGIGNDNGQGLYPAITPDLAYRLDAKMDDGLPLTGRIGAYITCSGGAGWVGPPSTYQLITSTCNLSMVKLLWE